MIRHSDPQECHQVSHLDQQSYKLKESLDWVMGRGKC